MKIKSIRKVLNTKFEDWLKSITDEGLRKQIAGGTIITGGCIPSMLLREDVNDFDLYFRTKELTMAVAEYYVRQFQDGKDFSLRVDINADGRIRVLTNKSGEPGKASHMDRGVTVGDITAATITDPGAIEDTYDDTERKALQTEDETDRPKYRPVFITTNAITLTNKVQLVLRFYGEPEEIHKNYDFVHCTNYWSSWDNDLVLRQAALESLMTKELRYVGSKYPVCSIIRLRKFIARQWTVNAGQILKMIMQAGELDLTDPKVLEDQLTGVDSAYFCELIGKLKDKDPEKINCAYLCEIIDRIF